MPLFKRVSGGGKPFSAGDSLVQGIAVSLAVASGSFAIYMVAQPPKDPLIPGIEHLSLYSKPRVIADRRREQEPFTHAGGEVDYTATSAIAEQERSKIFDDLFVLEGTAMEALIATRNGVRLRVRKGDYVSIVGKVQEIRFRKMRWEVLTTKGVILQR